MLLKITSLSLLTILLTSSAVFALPNALPQAHAAANANLFVSAENSQFNNYFSGPQVIQVIVSDPDINRLDQQYAEPTVTVNGKRLRMAQATDGNWYAYFADRNQAIVAQNTAKIAGHGLNFGGFCNSASPLFSVKTGVDFSETKGFTVAKGGMGSLNTTVATPFPACDSTVAVGTPYQMEHVVRENKTINGNGAGFGAGIGPYSTAWPIIQLYDFAGFPTSVVVDYQKAGGDQIVNLTFDRMPQNLISMSSDRSSYPVNTQVFLSMIDQSLNIDPTEEDSWTWGANPANTTLIYEDFNRNGGKDADGTPGAVDLIPKLTDLMFNKNGKFTLNTAAQGIPVLNFQQNGKEQLTPQVGPSAAVRTTGGSLTAGSNPVTFIESGGVNTGVFTNKDGANIANLITVNNLQIRGVSATYFYNDVSQSIVGGFGFGTISVNTVNNTWNSGQKIPVILVDIDANKNSKLSEHLDVDLANVGSIPSMKIGNPFTLKAGDSAILLNSVTTTHTAVGSKRTLAINGIAGNFFPFNGGNAFPVDQFSQRGLLSPSFPGNSTKNINANQAIVFDLGTRTISDIQNAVKNNIGNSAPKFKGFNFLNYDFRALTDSRNNVTNNAQITSGEWFLLVNTTNAVAPFNLAGLQHSPGKITAIPIANVTSLRGFINLNGTGNSASNVSDHTGFIRELYTDPSIAKTQGVALMFKINDGSGTFDSTIKPVMADFFSIGIVGDGLTNQRVNNAIYRWEMQETGANTSTFVGTAEYTMLNQVNIFDPVSYDRLQTISTQVHFAAIQQMLQSDATSPQISYLDLGADGVSVQLSAQQDIRTHTGTVSFNANTYKFGDTVINTINDPDLNSNSDLIEIYTVVPFGADPAQETLGKIGEGTYSDGSPFGRLFNVQFGQDNVLWTPGTCPGYTTGLGGTTPTGLGSSGLFESGFTLVEIGTGTSTFQGTYEIPDLLCQNGVSISSAGQNIKVNYFDFRDDSGNISNSSAIIKFNSTKLTIAAPSNTSVNTDQGVCTTTNPSIGIATAKGGILPITISDNRPNPFPLGNTTVTWKATDSSSPAHQTANANQIVTVLDNQNPTITAPPNISKISSIPIPVSLGNPTVKDNCPGVLFSNNAPAVFPLGTTTVTWTAKDVVGHKSNAIQKVTITTTTQVITVITNTINGMSLPKGEQTSLGATLKNIDPSSKSACSKLDAFISKVNNDLSHGKLTLSQAATLLSQAKTIKIAIGC